MKRTSNVLDFLRYASYRLLFYYTRDHFYQQVHMSILPLSTTSVILPITFVFFKEFDCLLLLNIRFLKEIYTDKRGHS